MAGDWLPNWREMTWPRKALFLGCASFLIGYGIWQGAIWWYEHEPLDQAAEKIVQAYENGNARTLWFYADEGEKEQLALTPAKIDRFLRDYYRPAMSSAVRGPREITPSTERSQYVFTQQYTVDGRQTLLDIVVFRTPKGPKANVVTPGIWAVVYRQYGNRHQDVTGSRRLFRIRADGIAGERKRLEALGFMGAKESAPGKPLRKWSDLEGAMRRMGYRTGPILLPPSVSAGP